jgi:hypothetical protein
VTTHYLAEMHSYAWQATNVIAATDRGRFEVYASLDGQLWDVEFTPADGKRIQLVASGLESFDAAQMAAAEHYAKLRGGE